MLVVASSNTALLAGSVTKTSLVPAEKLTGLSLLELWNTVVRVKLAEEPSKVPRPVSNSAPPRN